MIEVDRRIGGDSAPDFKSHAQRGSPNRPPFARPPSVRGRRAIVIADSELNGP
ncbi:hypothetical protein X946_4896 [Burkholderia sp. ABCPW 111]|nr:hypothetical protein X946_4896 [Burkholderia sp. ABCPW 111]